MFCNGNRCGPQLDSHRQGTLSTMSNFPRLWPKILAFAMGLSLLGAPAQAQSPFKTQPNSPAVASEPALPAIPSAPGAAPAPAAPAAGQPPQPISGVARQMYEQARSKLLQIRVVAKGRTTQQGVGSGFYVSSDGLIVTNFHVISRVALKPDRFQALFLSADGVQGELKLLAFDIRNDLAVLKSVKNEKAPSYFSFRPLTNEVNRGERIFSMGNPLDIGFAVVEGTYNGLIAKSFYPQIFFSGAINAGMSGGPALDEQGRIIGVNVAKRLDGESVAFLVPASKAIALIDKVVASPIANLPENPTPSTGGKVDAGYNEVTAQLTAHQVDLVERFISEPFKPQAYGPYRLPLPSEAFFRCWSSDQSGAPSFKFERTDCRMESRVNTGQFSTGFMTMRHEVYDAKGLHPARYATVFGDAFRNEAFVAMKNPYRSLSKCQESTIDQKGMVLRAVVCLNALKRHPGLYDINVLVGSLNENQAGLQARLDATGVTYANAQRLMKKYLEGFAWQP
jgi:serine protease Do